MAVLQSTNVQGTLCVNGVAIGGGKDLKFACFTASDSWTPTSGLVDGDGVLDIFLLGGGGGGARCVVAQSQNCGPGGTGGAGGVATGFLINMTSSNDACTITIGAGGAGKDNTGEGSGCNGGDTIFNTASLAACGAAAFGGGGGANQWGNAGGLQVGRSYRRSPNDMGLSAAGAGCGGYGTGMSASNRGQTGVVTKRATCGNLINDGTTQFVGFGSMGFQVSQENAAGGVSGQPVFNSILGWVGSPGLNYSNGGQSAGPGIQAGEGCSAIGYGNGGNGSQNIAAGSGSSGVVVLKWAE